jgi:hypothetical protein
MPACSTRRVRAFLTVALIGLPLPSLRAQTATTPEPPTEQPPAPLQTVPRKALVYVRPFLSAAWSQTLGTPEAWKRTWGGYGSRVGDQFGFLLVGEGARRLVDRAVPWENDRSPCVQQPHSFSREVIVRASCAITRTTTLRTATGARRPNLPLFAGITVATATSLSWHPEQHTAVTGRAYVAQRIATSYGAAIFWRFLRDWRTDTHQRR